MLEKIQKAVGGHAESRLRPSRRCGLHYPGGLLSLSQKVGMVGDTSAQEAKQGGTRDTASVQGTQSSPKGQRIAGGKARTAGKRQPSRAYP
ncbi:unnamed protein product, partial [Ectocarpus sp. 8 AP-2014]